MGAVEKEIFFATSWWHREFEDASFFAQKSDQATVFMADGGPLEHIYFCTTKALGGGRELLNQGSTELRHPEALFSEFLTQKM